MSATDGPEGAEKLTRLLINSRIIIGVVSAFTCSGLVFGFAGLYNNFIQHGIFHEYCRTAEGDNAALNEDPDFPLGSCDEQRLQLSLLFTSVTTMLNLVALPAGALLDALGPRLTGSLAGATVAVGCFVFGVLQYYYVGFLLMGITGPLVYMSTVTFANYYPTKTGLVSSMGVGAFDASSFVFVILGLGINFVSAAMHGDHVAHPKITTVAPEATNFAAAERKPLHEDGYYLWSQHTMQHQDAFNYVFMAYACIPLTLAVLMFRLYPNQPVELKFETQQEEGHVSVSNTMAGDGSPKSLPQDKKSGRGNGSRSSSNEDIENILEACTSLRKHSRTVSFDERSERLLQTPTMDTTARSSGVGTCPTTSDLSQPLLASDEEKGIFVLELTSAKYEGKSVKEQILTPEFGLFAYTIGVYMVRLNFFISSVPEQMKTYFPAREALTHTAFFSCMLPAFGILSIPGVGFLTDKMGVMFSWLWLWAMFLLYEVLYYAAIFLHDVGAGGTIVSTVLYAGFCCFCFARPLTYTMIAVHTGRIFGFGNFGTLYGLVCSVAGAFNGLGLYGLSMALAWLMPSTSPYSYTPARAYWALNLLLTGVLAMTLVLPMYMLWERRKRGIFSRV